MLEEACPANAGLSQMTHLRPPSAVCLWPRRAKGGRGLASHLRSSGSIARDPHCDGPLGIAFQLGMLLGPSFMDRFLSPHG